MSVCFLNTSAAFAKDHSAEYQVGLFSATGQLNDGTVSQCHGNGCHTQDTGHNVHYVRTRDGVYTIEAPVSRGMSALASLASNGNSSEVHIQWFMDQLHEGDKVLFRTKCNKHNNCFFWLPKPDKEGKEYSTYGHFQPDAAQTNTQQLCGKGKLSPDVEAQVCQPATVPPAPAPASPATTQAAPASQQ